MAQSISWIQELTNKMLSKRSPVCFIVTNDSRRLRELLSLLTMKDGTGEPFSKQVFTYDGWKELVEVKLGNDGIEYEDSKIPEDEDTLRYLYGKLQEDRTNIILKNYDASFFLRWMVFLSTDFSLFRKKSNLLVLVDDANQVPPEMIEKVNIVDIVTLPHEREKVVADELQRMRVKDMDIVRISRALSGLNLDQTEAALVGSMYKFKQIDMPYLQQQKREVIARRGNLTLLDSNKGFESIGGYEYVRNFLNDFIVLPMRHPSEAAKMGVELPKGLLLFGIEGTGKTIISRALGKELDMPVVQFHTGQFKAKYVGETERLTRNAIKGIQELSPCVVFIDEIEHMGFRPKGDGDTGVSLNQFTMLLSFMSENHGSILVGTTNKIDELDPAFMRAGRLDYYLPMMLPDEDARRAIWKVHTEVVRRVPLGKDVNVDKVVEMTAWFNGAEIELLAKTSSAIALKEFLNRGKKGTCEVRMEHILKAFEERQVNKDDRKKRTGIHKAKAEELCPAGIVKAAFRQSIDAKTVAQKDTLREYDLPGGDGK